MLNIQIDNPELEEDIRETYGNDTRSIANAFAEFMKRDISVSIQQLDAGEGIPLSQVMESVRDKYE